MEPQHNDLKRPAPGPAAAMQSEAESECPSIIKRPRVWEPQSIGHSSNTPQRGATILDVLNADCWRHLLDYITVGDIVRSERVSRAWQRVVWEYLAGVHEYQIVYLYTRKGLQIPKFMSKLFPANLFSAVSITKYRVIYIHLPKRRLFRKMIQKMGPYIVSMYAARIDEKKIQAIAKNCPNLKILKIKLFVAVTWNEYVCLGILKKCKQLKHLALYLSNQGGDCSLNEIVTSESLEELIIAKHDRLTGCFLKNTRTTLKTLIFVDCDFLSIENILSMADRLTALTRLELIRNGTCNLQNLHLLLDRTPNLESLCLQNSKNMSNGMIKLGNELPTAIARLSRLRDHRLWNHDFVTDEWLAIVARGCPALRSIAVQSACASARGLRALCRARPELEQLVVRHPTIKDEDIEACVRSCKGLELLDVSFSYRLTRNLPARLAWSRERPLRLRIYHPFQRKTEVKYGGITALEQTSQFLRLA